MNTLNVALIGFGNIGTGVVRFFQENGEMISNRCGRPVKLHTICSRDLKRDRGVSIDAYKHATDFKSVIADPEIHVILELVGGTGIAKDIILAALGNGKHVVTANKAVVAEYGAELFDAARKNSVALLFEAAIGAGIPFVRAIQGGLLGNNYNGVFGILNGTCNYILTEMESDPEKSFDDVLKVAMDLGYAEPDPTLDIEGDDAAHKIAIMGSLAYGEAFTGRDVIKTGITRITPDDFAFAKKHSQTIRLIASATKSDGAISLSVAPTLLPDAHLIAGIRGVTNTCMIDCDQAGPMQFSGAGAGQGSTASGVMGDVCHLATAGSAVQQMNPLTIRSSESKTTLNPSPYPKRILRVTGKEAKAAIEKLGFSILDEANDSVFAVCPAQSVEHRSNMIKSLENSGFGGSKTGELRVAFQSAEQSLLG